MRYHRAVLYLNQAPNAANPHVADVYCFADGNDNEPTFSVDFSTLSFAGVDVGPLSTLSEEQIIEVGGSGLTDAEIRTQQMSTGAEPDDVYRLVIEPDTGTDMPVVPVEQL